jgi:hypothetical protein
MQSARTRSPEPEPYSARSWPETEPTPGRIRKHMKMQTKVVIVSNYSAPDPDNDNPMPTWFLAPIAGPKLPALKQSLYSRYCRSRKHMKMRTKVVVVSNFRVSAKIMRHRQENPKVVINVGGVKHEVRQHQLDV